MLHVYGNLNLYIFGNNEFNYLYIFGNKEEELWQF